MDLIAPAICKTFFDQSGEVSFRLKLSEILLKSGELTFLMGHNGSGKSVYGKIISGDIPSDHGNIDVSWVNRSDFPLPVVGVVRQHVDQNLALDLTVEENVLLRLPRSSGLEAFTNGSAQSFEKMEQILTKHVAVSEKRHHPTHSLSLGQRQTLAFLCSSSNSTDLLLLDEFLASTDHSTSDYLISLVKEHVYKLEASAIIVSHDPNMALQEADRILVLSNGNLAADIFKGEPEWNENHLKGLIRL